MRIFFNALHYSDSWRGEEGEKGSAPKSKIQIKDIRSVGHGNPAVLHLAVTSLGSIQREIIILLVLPIERLLLN